MKRIIGVFLMLALMINMCGCGINSKVISSADDFMNLVMNMKFSKMKKVAEDYEVFDKYADDELLAAILGRGEYEADKKSLSENGKKASISYEITLPDYEEVIDDGDYKDIDEFIDNLEDAGTTSVKLKLEFKLKDDLWIVTNCEDIVEDLFEEILDNDFGLGAFSSLIPLTPEDMGSYASDNGFDLIVSNPDSFSVSGLDAEGVKTMNTIWFTYGYAELIEFDNNKNAMKYFEDYYDEDTWFADVDGIYKYQVSGNSAMVYCDGADGSLDVFVIAFCVDNTVLMTTVFDDPSGDIIDFLEYFGYPTYM
ncbi:MAG: hypothetical protein MJ172_11900 [Clostridia bacterium]|nr:hypothetical protein [Clostridia bacterium]